MINILTIERGTNVNHTIEVEQVIDEELYIPNITTEWSSFSAFLLDQKGTILLKWNWQKDAELLSGYLQAALGSSGNYIVLPFSYASTIALQLGKANMLVKFKDNNGVVDEFPIYKNAFEVIETSAKTLATE
jgi:hypothetical protein